MIENTEIQTINPPRFGKKLLVLDIDGTIADFHDVDAKREDKTRPYLHTFLETLYRYYDIVIWSCTEPKHMFRKIHSLGMWQNKKFGLLACLDLSHTRVRSTSLGTQIMYKPLEILWDKYPEYDTTNTILLDDKVENMCFHRSNGILITAYDSAEHATDNELLYLITYLVNLAQYCHDFSTVNHKLWPYYDPVTN